MGVDPDDWPTLTLHSSLPCPAALVNIAFGFSTSLTVWCFLWALNGILQVRPLGPC